MDTKTIMWLIAGISVGTAVYSDHRYYSLKKLLAKAQEQNRFNEGRLVKEILEDTNLYMKETMTDKERLDILEEERERLWGVFI